MSALTEIEKLTKEYANERGMLSATLNELDEELSGVKTRYMRGIQKLAERAALKKSLLHAAIESAPEAFEQPRSYVFHGVKVGIQKGRGKIEWEADEQVVKLIKKFYPDTWDTYIKTTEKPSKSALENLTVAELKKIGVAAVESGDKVVIKPVDGEVEKLIDALYGGDEISRVIGEKKEAA